MACGGPICDITVYQEPAMDLCSGDNVVIEVHDVAAGGPGNHNGADPAYDVDVYLYDSDGNQIADVGNLWNTGLVIFDGAVTNETCAPLTYTLEVVCFASAPGPPGTNELSIPLSFTMYPCLLYTSPSPRDRTRSRMPSSA